MKIGVYLRVSLEAQDLSSQRHRIAEWLAAHAAGSTVVEYVDHGISGKRDDRPAFRQLCHDAATGIIDTVVVYRLDRLSRKAATAMQMLLTWMQTGVSFVAVDQPILHLTDSNPFRLTFVAMFSEISQLERETIVSRVKAGLAAAKARGVKLGNKAKLSTDQQAQVRKLRRTGVTYEALSNQFNVGVATIHRVCNQQAK